MNKKIIHATPTVKNNKGSISVEHNDIVALVIFRSTKFNWEKLTECIPQMNKRAVPYSKRKLFGDHATITNPPRNLRSDAKGTPIAHSTRSRRRRSSQTAPLRVLYNP